MAKICAKPEAPRWEAALGCDAMRRFLRAADPRSSTGAWTLPLWVPPWRAEN